MDRKEKWKKRIVAALTLGYLACSMISPVFAYGSFNPVTHSHYVPATYDGEPDELVTGRVVDGISFYITKINNENDDESNYTTIRACLIAKSTTMWYAEGKTAPKFISGKGSNIAHIAMSIGKKYTVYTADFNVNTVSVAYYGNSSSKDAYVYIQESFTD